MLSQVIKSKLKSELFEILYQSHMESDTLSDFIMNGGSIVGLNDYTDEELVEEYRTSVVYDEQDELYLKAVAEIEAHKTLTG